MRRLLVPGVILSLVAVACAQDVPDRGPLPTLPDQLVFPAPTTTLIPQDGSCVVTTSAGMRIDGLEESADAANVLAIGDVIVGIDGIPVRNQSTLRAGLSGRSPGSPVDITYERDGSETTVTVTLGAAPDDPDRGMIGVVVRPQLVVTHPEDIPTGPVEANRLLVGFDDGLYAVDPTTNEWVSLGLPAPEFQIVQLGDDLLTVSEEGTGLVTLDGSRRLDLPADGVRFVAPLGVLGDALVYSVARQGPDGALLTTSVVAADIESGEILWTRQTPPAGTSPPLPVVGYPDPTGRFIVVSHQHDDGRLHTVYGADGTPVAGWGSGSEDLASGTVLAGWIDERRLVATGATGDGRFLAVLIDVDDIGGDPEIFDLEVENPTSVYAVTGASKVLVGAETETLVFDLEQQTFDAITANCGLEVLGRTR